MASLKSVDDAIILGFYQPFYLFASVRHGRAKTAKSPAEVQDNFSPDDLVGYALERYTFLHEIRHFHDCFGTMAGISLFNAHLQQVRAFAEFIEFRRSRGKSHSLPLDATQFEDQESQDLFGGLLRNWRIFLRSTARFTEAFERTVEDGHHPQDHVIYKKADASGAEVPTFPFSMGSVMDGILKELTVYYPIGLEVMLEGNAQALQRGLMEIECPPGLADRLVPLMESRTVKSASPIDRKESLRVNAQPYNVTDLLVSKYLRLRGHPTFQRASILQLTDLALSTSFMRPLSKPWEVPATFQIVDIGRMFINMLEEAPIQDLVAGTVPYSPGISKIYQTVLDEISKSKKPEELTYERDFLSPIDMIDAVVAHHITAPLSGLGSRPTMRFFTRSPSIWRSWALSRKYLFSSTAKTSSMQNTCLRNWLPMRG